MTETLAQLVLIGALGIAGQWIAWRLGLPSILVLLLLGLLAGPATGVLDPDELLGDLLFPVVSLSVALILFEGGLDLPLRELLRAGGAVRNLVTIGAVVTGVVGAVSAHLILDLNWGIAALLGAILVVTGPTVIGPLLRQVRPVGRVGTVLRAEGILIDPIGATAALLVFEGVLAGDLGDAVNAVIEGVARTAIVGVGAGLAGAFLLTLSMRRNWVPDFLHNPVSFGAVIVTYLAADAVQEESGLLAVTIMGIALASQRWVPVTHILTFEEDLRTLLLSGIFIILAARLEPDAIADVGFPVLAFLAVLVLVARPLSVALATVRSGLDLRSRAFLAWMAPRGIVAAAVSSLFSIRLGEEGVEGAEVLVPVTFVVVIGTIALYGLTAGPLARRLGLADADPQGVLVVGADRPARAAAEALAGVGLPVLVADTDRRAITQARLLGLPVYLGNVLSPDAREQLSLAGIGRCFALTPDDGYNAIVAQRAGRWFGRRQTYQLRPASTQMSDELLPAEERGHLLFGGRITWAELGARLDEGCEFRATRITGQFDLAAWRSAHPYGLVLAVVRNSGKVDVVLDGDPKVAPGDRILALVEPRSESNRAPDGGNRQATGDGAVQD